MPGFGRLDGVRWLYAVFDVRERGEFNGVRFAMQRR
jgi:hypothetical protein